MDTIKYKVTGPYGCRSVGEIVEAHLVVEDQDSSEALILHKPNDIECGSFEICRKDSDGYYVSTSGHYINFEKMDEISFD
jgi:hypothetical protein